VPRCRPRSGADTGGLSRGLGSSEVIVDTEAQCDPVGPKAVSGVVGHETKVGHQVEALGHRHVDSSAGLESQVPVPGGIICGEPIGQEPSPAPDEGVGGAGKDVLQACV